MQRFAGGQTRLSAVNQPRPRQSSEGAVKQRKHKPDYLLAATSLCLILLGLIVVYAISPGIAAATGVTEAHYIFKQVVAATLGLVGFLAVSHLPISIWRKLEKPLIGAAALTAVVVKLFGDEVYGAQRWIQIGGLSFQAAELIKLALVIWIAGFLADRARQRQLTDFKLTLKPLIFVLVAIAVVVAGLESDLGSAGVMIVIMVACAFLVGLPMKKIILFGALILLIGVLAISTSGYRRSRVTTFLNPERDCQNAGYQVCESLKAIGSGGIFGKGLGRSVQAYGYLPKAENDSIFAIISEKFGFFGVSMLLSLYVLLFTRMKRIIELTQDLYSRLLVMGIMAWLAVQTLVNIGAMIGLIPLKGITLPLISAGGTSLLFVCIALGIVFQISRYTSFRAVESVDVGDIGSSSSRPLPRVNRPTVLRRNG